MLAAEDFLNFLEVCGTPFSLIQAEFREAMGSALSLQGFEPPTEFCDTSPQLTYILRSRAARSVFFNNFSPSPSRSQVHWHEAVHDAALLLPYLLSVVTASLTSGTLDLHPLFLLKPKLTHLFQRTTFEQQFSKNNFHFLIFFSISINSTVTISFGLHL